MIPTKEVGKDANFSVILPGGCNAKCEFCFWEQSQSVSPFYIEQLIWHLAELSKEGLIHQVSITGGETTLSPMFDDVLRVLKEFGHKVVLATNATRLLEKIPSMAGCVNHINISRHSIDDDRNSEIFGCTGIPKRSLIEEICEVANDYGIDVTLNRVIPPDYSDELDFEGFVGFARQVGASGITMRVDYNHGVMSKTPLEENLGMIGERKRCPVCETRSYLRRGIKVNVKNSLLEPSEKVRYIHEFIYHPDGRLTEDWAGEKEIEYTNRHNPGMNTLRFSSGAGGCGHRGTGGGC